MHGEDLLDPVFVGIEHLDLAVDDDEEVDAALTAFVDERAVGQALFGAVLGDAPRHGFGKAREGLRLACVRIGRIDHRAGGDGGLFVLV